MRHGDEVHHHVGTKAESEAARDGTAGIEARLKEDAEETH
jgi:hypothetical protein